MHDYDSQELQRSTPGALQPIDEASPPSAIGKSTLTADVSSDAAELDGPESDEPMALAATTAATDSPLLDAPQWEAVGHAEAETGGNDVAEPRSQERSSQHATAERPLQRARAMNGTAHRRFDLSMSTQVDEHGRAGWGVVDHVRDRTAAAMRVDVKVPQVSPLVVAPGARPTEEQLVERSEHGRHRVTHRRGTLEKPNTHNVMDPEKLVIGGKPDAADVRQGGIGDCYFQAALLAVANNDPDQISKMISMVGDQAVVTFYRFDRGRAEPVRIQTSNTLLTRRSEDGSRFLAGAGVRRAAAPLRTSWWANVASSTLELHRRNVWEVAMWAALVEKAFAHFAELHGRFGTGLRREDREPPGGYDIVDQGGWTEACFPVIYGSAAKSEALITEFSTGDDLVLRNEDTMMKLISYESTRNHTGPGETQGFLEAHVGSAEAVHRCLAISEVVLQHLSIEQGIDNLAGALLPGDAGMRTRERNDLRDNLYVLQGAIDDYRDDEQKTGDALATFAALLLSPDVFPALWQSRAPCYQHLRESLGVLTTLGSFDTGQRSIIASHAYNVKSVDIRDHRGAALVLAPDDVKTRLRDVDALQSSVVVENPHAGNELDLRGDGPTDKRPDGRFTLTLDQFLRMFGGLGIAAVTH